MKELNLTQTIMLILGTKAMYLYQKVALRPLSLDIYQRKRAVFQKPIKFHYSNTSTLLVKILKCYWLLKDNSLFSYTIQIIGLTHLINFVNLRNLSTYDCMGDL